MRISKTFAIARGVLMHHYEPNSGPLLTVLLSTVFGRLQSTRSLGLIRVKCASHRDPSWAPTPRQMILVLIVYA